MKIIRACARCGRGAKVFAVTRDARGDYYRMDGRERMFCLTATTRVSFSLCPTISVQGDTGGRRRAFKRPFALAPARLPHRKSRRKQSIEYHNAYANRNETLYLRALMDLISLAPLLFLSVGPPPRPRRDAVRRIVPEFEGSANK